MQSSDNAFDRVKSLLGKLDRSIDDARQKRLHPEEEVPDLRDEGEPQFFQTEADPDAAAGENQDPENDRPTSKYGRAKPIRELNGGPNGGAWKTA
jgi:hypothetical protein